MAAPEASHAVDRRVGAGDAVDFTGDMVRIYVGNEQKPFQVHEAVLQSSSQFFKAALKKDWFEDQEKEASLPEETPEVFNIYIQYLYSGELACKSNSWYREYAVLAELYALSTHLMDHVLEDRSLDALMAAIQDYIETATCPLPENALPPLEIVNCIYNATADGSPGRRMMVDVYAACGQPHWKIFGDGLLSASLHPDFVLDLAKALMQRRLPSGEAIIDLASGKTCVYHYHAVGQHCAAKQ